MKKRILVIAAFLIGSSAIGQTLNQYSNIPNIEKLDVSMYGIMPNAIDYVLFASSDTLYKSSYDLGLNQLGNYNGNYTSVTDITHTGGDFAVSTTNDVTVYDMTTITVRSTIPGNIVSVCMDGAYVTSVNNIGTDIYRANTAIWLGPTSFSVYEPLVFATPPPIQKVINDLGGEFYYMTKARLIYAENQREIRGLNSVWNATAANIHNNNDLLDFGMFVSPFDNDTMFHFVYDNGSGYVYNANTDSVELYFLNTNFGATSIGFNETDGNLYYTRPNSDKVYSVNTNTSNIIDFSTVAYTMPGMNNSTEIEFDNDGNIWVSGDNGVFTNIAVTGMVTDANNLSTSIGVDENETLNDVNLYPNPNNGNFTINNIENETNVNVISVTGQIVHSLIVENSKVQLDLDVPTGIYFVQLSNELEQRTIKFIKH